MGGGKAGHLFCLLLTALSFGSGTCALRSPWCGRPFAAVTYLFWEAQLAAVSWTW
jgi:hypothetical protein